METYEQDCQNKWTEEGGGGRMRSRHGGRSRKDRSDRSRGAEWRQGLITKSPVFTSHTIHREEPERDDIGPAVAGGGNKREL